MASDNLDVRQNAISELSLAVVSDGDAQMREVILQRLALMIRRRDEVIPPGSDPYKYCFEGAPDKAVPGDVQAAINVIGRRSPADAETPIDLSNTNLAYSRMYSLDMRNVRFDDTVMCRVLFSDSDLSGATLNGANLRWSVLNCVQGLTLDQLAGVGRLYGAYVPLPLAQSETLRVMIEDDPDWDPDPESPARGEPPACG